ncbi:MAG: uroporphyrinogen decarboxylase family protein [Clostridia bacterium]|nr:uroporphyrinogen decarboxylase family protein [Clostridia bacterium]
MMKLTSYERVMRRLRGEPVDKVPNMNIVMAFAAKHIGASYREYCTDYRVLVESKLACAEDFGIDNVSVISDPMREAHGFGAKVIIPEHDVPYCKEHLITSLDDINKLKPVDPMDDERMLDRIRAVELFKKQVKGKLPIIGWVEGALAEACDLRDISAVMMDLMLEPERIKTLFEVIYEQQKSFAKAQVEAGADIIGVGNAAASLVGPSLYKTHCLEFDRRIVQDIHQWGAKVELHICGNTTQLFECIAKTGADIFDVDHVADFGHAIQVFKGTNTVANGNYDPVGDMMSATPEQVERAIMERLKLADERTLISGGCEIPAATPVENMKLMDRLLYLKGGGK